MVDDPHRWPNIRNGILSKLAGPDFACIRPYLQPVALKERAMLQEFKKPIEHVYFIESGIVSLRTIGAGSMLETATVGSYGADGALVALGTEVSMHRSIVLVAGSALRIDADDLRRAMIERPAVRERLLHYIQALLIQCSQTALCGVCHELEQRLACWLSVACDAIDGGVLPMTHDHLSIILGLRRAGLTEALIRFKEQGLIRNYRGVLEVHERKRLREKSCGCYGVIAGAYQPARTPEVSDLGIGNVSHRVTHGPANPVTHRSSIKSH